MSIAVSVLTTNKVIIFLGLLTSLANENGVNLTQKTIPIINTLPDVSQNVKQNQQTDTIGF